jgi:hypothetical protein
MVRQPPPVVAASGEGAERTARGTVPLASRTRRGGLSPRPARAPNVLPRPRRTALGSLPLVVPQGLLQDPCAFRSGWNPTLQCPATGGTTSGRGGPDPPMSRNWRDDFRSGWTRPSNVPQLEGRLPRRPQGFSKSLLSQLRTAREPLALHVAFRSGNWRATGPGAVSSPWRDGVHRAVACLSRPTLDAPAGKRYGHVGPRPV